MRRLGAEAEIAYEQVDLAFVRNFSWGSLRVSQLAEQAYNLKPILPVHSGDYAPPGRSYDQPAVDIWLLSPMEVTDNQYGLMVDYQAAVDPDLSPAIKSHVQNRRLSIATGFRQSTSDLYRQELDRLDEFLKPGNIDELTSSTDIEDFKKSTWDHDIPERFVSGLANYLGQSAVGGIAYWHKANDHRRYQNELSIIELAFAGSVSGLIFAEGFSGQTSLGADFVPYAGSYLGLLAVSWATVVARHKLKPRLRHRENLIYIQADRQAQRIGRDIRELFPAVEFNQ